MQRLPVVARRRRLPLLPPLTLAAAVEALSRGEGDGVLAVPLLAATLQWMEQTHCNLFANVLDTRHIFSSILGDPEPPVFIGQGIYGVDNLAL